MPRSVTSAGDAIATALNSAKSSVDGFMSNDFESCLKGVRLSFAVIVVYSYVSTIGRDIYAKLVRRLSACYG